MRDDSFSYRLFIVNAPLAQDSNTVFQSFNQANAAGLHDLRMTFLWPQLPNGKLGNGRQTFRTSVAGNLKQDRINWWFFYQPQFYSSQP